MSRMRGRRLRAAASAPVAIAVALTVLLSGCTSAPDPRGTATSSPPASSDDDASAEPDLAHSPTPTVPPEWCTPTDLPRASLPGVALPAPGEHVTLQLDPCLTAKSLLGSYSWLKDQWINADLIQGFESVADIEPWIAPRTDGSGSCLLIRADDSNGWREISCDSPDAPATVERTLEGSTLHFVIENDRAVAYVTSP